jgi:hypothetical protein
VILFPYLTEPGYRAITDIRAQYLDLKKGSAGRVETVTNFTITIFFFYWG